LPRQDATAGIKTGLPCIGLVDSVGFESASHLSKQFKKRIGASSLDWRVKFARQQQRTMAGNDSESFKPGNL